MNGALFVLSLALFATMLGNGLVIPFIPIYAQEFGAHIPPRELFCFPSLAGLQTVVVEKSSCSGVYFSMLARRLLTSWPIVWSD